MSAVWVLFFGSTGAIAMGAIIYAIFQAGKTAREGEVSHDQQKTRLAVEKRRAEIQERTDAQIAVIEAEAKATFPQTKADVRKALDLDKIDGGK